MTTLGHGRSGSRIVTFERFDMALYDDVGGAPAVRAALNAFYARVLADATLSPFFLGVDIERLKKTQEGFFAMAMGGPNAYTGRSLHEAHARTRRRGVNQQEFDHFLSVFKRVLIDLGIPTTKVGEWLAVFEGARGQILNRYESPGRDPM
jgi:hemoglobin